MKESLEIAYILKYFQYLIAKKLAVLQPQALLVFKLIY